MMCTRRQSSAREKLSPAAQKSDRSGAPTPPAAGARACVVVVSCPAHAVVTLIITFLHFTGYIILNLQVLIPVWSWWWFVVVRTLSWWCVDARAAE